MKTPSIARDLGMQRTAIAHGEVQGEVLGACPGSQDLGIGGQEEVRGRQPGRGCACLERVPDRRVQSSVMAAEARIGQSRGIDRQWQGGRGRQRVESGLPIGARSVGRGGGTPQMQDVVAEGQVSGELRGGPAMIKVEDLLEQQVVALAIEDQRIDAQMQAPVLGRDARDPDLEQRPAVAGQHLMGHRLAHRASSRLRLERQGLRCGRQTRS